MATNHILIHISLNHCVRLSYFMCLFSSGLQSFRESVIGGPLPNARLISFNVAEDRDIPDHIQTVMLMQWGQFVDHDVTLTAISKIFTDPSGK